MDKTEKLGVDVLCNDMGFDEHSAKQVVRAAKHIYKRVNKDIDAALKTDIKNGNIKLGKAADGRQYVILHDGVDPDVGIWADDLAFLTDAEMKTYDVPKK